MFQLQRATWVRAHDGSLHNGQHIVQCALGQTRGQHYVFIENILGDQSPLHILKTKTRRVNTLKT